MKLIQTKLARSIWLFDIRDMNPKGKDIIGDLVSWIKESYDFAVAPDSNNPLPNATPPPTTAAPKAEVPLGLTFQRGSFQAEEEIYVAINNLTIYDDGIVIDSASSTEDGDKFGIDLLKSAAQEFALTFDADTVRKRLYLSELVVRSDINLTSLSPILPTFLEKISSAAVPFAVGGISFWTDADAASRHKTFRFERQAGRALDENRYFSDAQMETKAHFIALQEFERLVMGR
jgi:hypothetical protein